MRGMPARVANDGRGGVALPGGDFFAPAEPQLSPFSQAASAQLEGMPDHNGPDSTKMLTVLCKEQNPILMARNRHQPSLPEFKKFWLITHTPSHSTFVPGVSYWEIHDVQKSAASYSTSISGVSYWEAMT